MQGVLPTPPIALPPARPPGAGTSSTDPTSAATSGSASFVQLSEVRTLASKEALEREVARALADARAGEQADAQAGSRADGPDVHAALQALQACHSQHVQGLAPTLQMAQASTGSARRGPPR